MIRMSTLRGIPRLSGLGDWGDTVASVIGSAVNIGAAGYSAYNQQQLTKAQIAALERQKAVQTAAAPAAAGISTTTILLGVLALGGVYFATRR